MLLALLVVTGFAGTLRPTSMSGKERKFAVGLMKDTKSDVLKTVKGLSDAQLNFRAAPDKWSVKECAYHIAIAEKNIWKMLDDEMKNPANPEKRTEIKVTDEQVVTMLEDRSHKVKTTESFEPKNTPYQSIDDAMNSFKETRAAHIKYIKNTTEDLRNHVLQTPLGWIDCYQVCLFMAGHTNRHTQQMNEVKADPNFPK
jgi:hypothetical protein